MFTLRFFLTSLLAALFAAMALHAAAAPASVTVLTVNGAIGPASASYIVRGIERAAADNSQLVVIRMDTPGGLDNSMRDIIKAILASKVPVASFVAPSGARAASAGTYILYASHIAAMAPGTNLGAATPVQVGGPADDGTRPKQPAKPPAEGKPADSKQAAPPGGSPDDATTSPSTRKQVNDAAAYIRSLAQLRGRNAEWAERAVREAVSLSAEEALKQQVIDHVATDVPALLKQLDGKTVQVLGQERTLQTADAAVLEHEPDWRAKLLAAITDPSVALLLMTIGLYGLIFEFSNPGFGVPGVLGAICLLLGMYALQMLPVNYAGLALILLGLTFMIAEAFFPSFGVLGFGGVIAFVVGAVILIDTDLPGFGIPLGLIITTAVASALLIAGLVGIAIKTRRLPAGSGLDAMRGAVGEVFAVSPHESWAYVNGERWQVASSTALIPGQRVKVIARHGLLLDVAPLDGP